MEDLGKTKVEILDELQKLRKKEEVLRIFIRHIPDILWVKDGQGHYILCNETFEKVFGHKEEDVVGKTDYDFFPKEIAEFYSKFDLKAINEGKPSINEEIIKYAQDSKEVLFETVKTPMYDSQGNLIGVLGLARDITERKRIEEALILNESRYDAYINSSSDMVFLKDENLKYLIVNEPFASFFEIDKDEVIGNCDLFFLSEEAAAICKSSDLQVLATNRLLITDEQLKGKILTTHKFKVPLGNGKYGVGGTIRDVTEQRMAKKLLMFQAEELRELNSTKDKFLSIISHDLRSPFQAFLGLTKIIAEELPNLSLDEIQKMVLGMKNSAENLYNLLENLLVWSQTQRGFVKFNPVKINLKSNIIASIGFVKEVAENKNITVKSEISESLAVFADEQMFESLINNLLINAIKFSHRNGEIFLSAKQNDDKTVQISVKDNGIGMNKNILENLFRLDAQENRKGTEGEPSTGLGLIICKEYVEKHNGTIWADSIENEGSTFHFTIPAS